MWKELGLAVGGDVAGALLGGAFNAREAHKNRSFQRNMSNTAYQRAADDLEAAGLNRILALGSPASTPSGDSASIGSPALGQTGIAAASAKQSIRQSKAQESLIREQEELSREQQTVARNDAALKAEQTRLTAAEASKAELTRMLYEKFGDPAEDMVDKVLPFFLNSGKRGVEPIMQFLEWMSENLGPRGAIKHGKGPADLIRDFFGERLDIIKKYWEK